MRFGFFHEVQKGGARRSVIEFGRHLTKLHEVDLYYVDSKRLPDDERAFSKAKFYKFTPKKWSGHNAKTRLYKDSIELYKLYRLHHQIASDINQRKYDAVFFNPSQYTQAPFLLRFVQSKKIYYCQEALRMVYDPLLKSLDDIPRSRRIYEQFVRSLRKNIDAGNLAYADVLIANSSYSKRNIQKAYGKRSSVCYMGVDTNVFKPKNLQKEIDVLYVGAYDVVDGLGLFENALKKLKSKPDVKILAREKEWISTDKDLCDLYNKAKVTVCISANEPFGLIPLESMASGTPVIALKQGGYKESVKHMKTGMLVKSSPDELANAINALLKNANLRKKMSDNARKDMVENWDWKKQTPKLERILKGTSDE